VFPVRYELNFNILFRRNSVSRMLIYSFTDDDMLWGGGGDMVGSSVGQF
jgi:hypothetical protein